MKEKAKSKKFPYVIKASLIDKGVCLLLIVLYLFIVWIIFNRWNATDAQDKTLNLVVILGFFIALCVFIIKLFFAKNILEDRWIIRTNTFLMKRRITYEEVKNVGITGNNMGVRLNLVDGSSVKIYCGGVLEAFDVARLIDKKIKSKQQRSTNG